MSVVASSASSSRGHLLEHLTPLDLGTLDVGRLGGPIAVGDELERSSDPIERLEPQLALDLTRGEGRMERDHAGMVEAQQTREESEPDRRRQVTSGFGIHRLSLEV